MNKEYTILIFTSVVALGFLPLTERIIFGRDEDFSYKELKKIENFGTKTVNSTKKKHKSSTDSTEQILTSISINKGVYNSNLNKRIFRELKPKIKEFQSSIEEFLNLTIKDIKKNKDITDRIILGQFFNSEQYMGFKQELYKKLIAANMETLYEPIKTYLNYLNSKFLPTIFKKLLIKKRFKMTKEDNFLIKNIVNEILNINMEFKLSEYSF